jgi:hypothetical protein
MRFKWLYMAMVVALACMGFALPAGAGPYAPAAGQPGSTAVHVSDNNLQAWATGWRDYVPGADVNPTLQTPDKALGTAGEDPFDIVCLGRGGRITLTFAGAITDGPGWDFAVFENSFSDVFLELAFVEVSSNGTDFFRFGNDSLTAAPVTAFGTVDPTDVDGLAGKYRRGYGTPFDLALLAGASPLLDVNQVGFVRLVDIVGGGTDPDVDTSGDVIYDPFPTSGSAGFDLDAVGVRNAAPLPVPATSTLLGGGLIGLLGLSRSSRRPV